MRKQQAHPVLVLVDASILLSEEHHGLPTPRVAVVAARRDLLNWGGCTITKTSVGVLLLRYQNVAIRNTSAAAHLVAGYACAGVGAVRMAWHGLLLSARTRTEVSQMIVPPLPLPLF